MQESLSTAGKGCPKAACPSRRERPSKPFSPGWMASPLQAWLLTGVLFLNLLVLLLATTSLLQSRRQVENQAQVTVENLAQVLDHELSASFDKIDLGLLAVADESARQLAAGGVDGAALNDFLARQLARQPLLESLRVADARGNVPWDAARKALPAGIIADRPYFTRLRDDAAAGLVVSKPLQSRVTGKWTIFMARRLNHPDGRFAGIVFAGVAVEHFQAVFAALNLGPRGAVSLRDLELGVVARTVNLPDQAFLIGNQVVSQAWRAALRERPDSGSYVARTAMDGIERANAYRRLAPYPFYINVGLSTEDILDAWWHEAAKTLGMVVAFALATFLLSWMIRRAWRQREADIQGLTRQEERFRTLLEAAPDALVVVDQGGIIVILNRRTEEVFGYAREELLGQPVEKLMPVRFRGCHMGLRQDYAAAPQTRQMGAGGELWGLTREGREFPIQVSLSPLETSRGGLVIAAVRDMSDRVAAEVALEAARRQRDEERACHAERVAVLSRSLMAVQEEERRRLALEVHDVVSPNLAAARINLGFLRAELADQSGRGMVARLEDTEALLQDTNASLRDICANLRPAMLDYAGLVPALESYVQQFSDRTGISVRLHAPLTPERLAPDAESLLFRITQEALTNCAKHAGARHIDVEFSHDGQRCRLAISDDGVGFDIAELGQDGRRPGLGLLTMGERAEFAGGRFSLESRVGEGTRITVEI